MKILHTSDWHLGKRLYQKELHEDHKYFFEWLTNYIRDNGIDVILISGDIFDLANPSSDARKLYYNALKQITNTGVQAIITGGNHDSPAMLNAPKELLQALNISVIGDLPEDITELVIPLGKDSEPQAIVAAIPFIRDNELQKLAPGQSYEERGNAVKEGIQKIFTDAALKLKEKYPNSIPIAMGHLFAHGVSTSESERDIQVGNLAGFESSLFPKEFQYIALGHIHKPQSAGAKHIQYSGSPIALSFSEKEDQKRIICFDIEDGIKNIESIPIPQWRQLIRISGNMDKIQDGLNNFENKAQLPAFIELELKEEKRNPAEILAVERLVENFNNNENDAFIVKYFISINEKNKSAKDLFSKQSIEALKPKEVFDKLLEANQTDQSSEKLLRDAFEEILQEYYQNEEA